MDTTTTTYPFLAGGGEMGALTRNYDWSTTALGTPGQWPLSLRTTVGIVLHSAFPMFLWWGPDLLCFYNDAYRVSLGENGKHPAVGKRGTEVWPEIWDFTGPLIEQVMRTGEPVFYEDQLVPIYRNGRMEDVYWTFSYSPAYDDTGQINGVFVTCTETTQTVLSRQQLTASREHLRRLIEEAPVAMALFSGPEFVISLANERVLEFWGRNREQVMDKPLFDALPEASGQGFEELLMGVYTTGERFVAKELPVTLERKGRLEQTYIDFVYEPFREIDGTISGITVVCVEITEQVLARQKIEESEARFRSLSAELDQQVQQRTNELRSSVLDLERSNGNLEKFAYVASHDLQEPLRKIQSFGDLLINHYADQLGDGVTYLERMQSAANRMSTLIRDLLTYSRIATQQETIHSVPLGQVIDSVLTDLELRIQETGAVVTVEPMPTLPGDQPQLEQLFQNLLSNALKFRRTGVSPVIHIGSQAVAQSDLPPLVRPARPAGAYYRIDVADNGIGFDQKYADRIFQVFQRLHSRSEFAGTGIGLAICEKVVANHGGAITATSQPGEGAVFSLYFPV